LNAASHSRNDVPDAANATAQVKTAIVRFADGIVNRSII